MEIEAIRRLQVFYSFFQGHLKEIPAVAVNGMVILAFSGIIRKNKIMESPLVSPVSIVMVTTAMLILFGEDAGLFDYLF